MSTDFDYSSLVEHFITTISDPYKLYKLFDLLVEMNQTELAIKLVNSKNNLEFISKNGKDKGDQYSCYYTEDFTRKLWHLEDREICYKLLKNKDLGLLLYHTIFWSSSHKIYKDRWVECLKILRDRIAKEYNDPFFDGQIRNIDAMIEFEENKAK